MSEVKDLSVVKRQVTMATAAANELVIDSTEGLAKGSDLLAKIKTVAKMVTERKEAFTRPAYDAYKEIMAQAKKLWDPLLDDCNTAETIVKRKGLEYKRKADEETRLAQEKIADRVERGTMKEDTAAKKIADIPVVGTKVEGDRGGSMTFKKVRVARIVDAEKLPRKYLVPDEKLIKKDALAGVEIPGVVVVEEDQVAGATF